VIKVEILTGRLVDDIKSGGKLASQMLFYVTIRGLNDPTVAEGDRKQTYSNAYLPT
jgi:hypothetical protein